MFVSDDTSKAVGRIETLRKLNKRKEWTNKDLYGLMTKEDLYLVAYEKIISQPGSTTSGTDNQSLDGASLEWIRTIVSEMRDCTFQFQPVKTIYIPKEYGKQRKLGVPGTRDAIVQEVMRMILDAIYEGDSFAAASHGFDPRRSAHAALREIRNTWHGTSWFVEWEIPSCFDEIDHHRLIEILREKISDQRFIDLIWKLLKAGEFDATSQETVSLTGNSQGSVISPMLANIYLSKLDDYVGKLREEIEQSAAREQPDSIRVQYIRYADNWLIGVSGSKATANLVQEKVKHFLKETLRLDVREAHTRVANARREAVSFLGYQISIGKTTRPPQKALSPNGSGVPFERRSAEWEVILKAPVPKLVARLAKKGYCKPNGEPTPKTAWQHLNVEQIISLYSSVNRSFLGYYRPADNFRELARIQYILEYSLAKTLAMKMRVRVSKVIQQGLKTTVNGKKVSFYKYKLQEE